MKVVFLIFRKNVFRNLAPLIEEGLKRGHYVECWYDYNQPKRGMKAYNFPYIENTPDFSNGNVVSKVYCGSENLLKKLSEDKEIDIVFSLNSFYHLFPDSNFDEFLFKWAII